MIKVLLITPPYHCGVVEAAGTWLPLNLVYLAGALRNSGYEVEIYDAMTKFDSHEDIARHIKNRQPDVVATGGFTATVNDCVKLLASAKEIDENIVTVLGGVHPTFCYHDILTANRSVDYIVIGEGEVTLAEVLDCHFAHDNPEKVKGLAWRAEDSVMASKPREFISDLDSLTPAWDLIDWPLYTYRPTPGSTLAVVSFARGCVSKCSFCSQQLFWQASWRARSPRSLVAELRTLKTDYGVDVVMIADESPATDGRIWRDLLNQLAQEDLGIEILMETRVVDVVRDEAIMDLYRKAGIVHVYVGVESGSPDTLARFNKDIKVEQSKQAIELINKAGMISETSFVLGMPEDTAKTIKWTGELAQYYNPDLAFFLAIAPWPYSDIYEELKPYIEVWDYSAYNLIEPIIKPRSMSRADVSKELIKAFRGFYLNKMKNLSQMSKFKQDYMMAVAKLLAEHSYLAGKMKMPGKLHDKLFETMGKKVGEK